MGQEAGTSPRPRFRPSRLRVLGRVTPRLPTSFSLLENEGLDSGSPVRSALCTGIRPRHLQREATRSYGEVETTQGRGPTPHRLASLAPWEAPLARTWSQLVTTLMHSPFDWLLNFQALPEPLSQQPHPLPDTAPHTLWEPGFPGQCSVSAHTAHDEPGLSGSLWRVEKQCSLRQSGRPAIFVPRQLIPKTSGPRLRL